MVSYNKKPLASVNVIFLNWNWKYFLKIFSIVVRFSFIELWSITVKFISKFFKSGSLDEFNNDLIELHKIKTQTVNFLEKLGDIVFSDKKDDKAKVEIIQSLFSEGGSSLEEILERINFVPGLGEEYLGALKRNKDKFKRVTNVAVNSKEKDNYEGAAARDSSSRY